MRTRRIAVCAAIVAVATSGACAGCSLFSDPSGDDLDRDGMETGDLTVVARNLEIPWEIRFLPNGDLLVTERPGRLTLLRMTDGTDGDRTSTEVPGVRHTGEGGLMGLALDPEFEANGRVYACFTTDEGGKLLNRVVRWRLRRDGSGLSLEERLVVLDGMAASSVHDGCRLEFGPDGHLFVTMGDAGRSSSAQDRSSLSGKIHRVATDGSVPPDNPFGTSVWSWGHRNPQGLAWDDRGRLWATEHGPSGLGSGRDELNLIEKGENYGWPDVTGDEDAPGALPPVLHSGSDTWAPAGVAFADASVFFGGLRGSALYEARPTGEVRAGERGGVELTVHLPGELGRIRVVRLGPDGALYLATSNRDGRGDPRSGDDRVLRVDPASLDR